MAKVYQLQHTVSDHFIMLYSSI